MIGGSGNRTHSARNVGSNSWHQQPAAAPGLPAHHGRAFARQSRGPWGLLQQFRWSPKLFRMLSSRRLLALLLVLASIAMFVTYTVVVSGGHPQDREVAASIHEASVTSILEGEPSLETNLSFFRPAHRVPPSPFLFFWDQSLPPGHPCQDFTLPPPPADKKRTGPRPCPVCYLPVEQAMEEMRRPPRLDAPVLKQLSYVTDLNIQLVPKGKGAAGSKFGGYRTLKDREMSFDIRESMNVHCGFVQGRYPGVGTGFDISSEDLDDMMACRGVVVASAIFGNYDQMQQPKNISEQARKNVCFFMFVDEETGFAISEDGTIEVPKKVGLWRVVVVHKLPYKDARRNGKIPKLLIHRLFPNAQYSLWLDGKLELVVDPYQILERFLWRSRDVYAISKHYKRFDVFEEAEANKAAGKYRNVSIDEQVEFYRQEGMTPYTDAKLPIVSDVPEGCVIIRAHTPLANLFSCLWFNEVDRFTSRDQLSFGIVRDKLMAKAPWRVNMFLDCERRNFVVQGYHRELLEQKLALQTVQNATVAGMQSAYANLLESPALPVYSPPPRPRAPPSRITKKGTKRRPKT